MVARQDPNTKRTIRSKAAVVIPPLTTTSVPVVYHGQLPNDRDFLFDPHCNHYLGTEGGVYAHIVDSTLSFVQLRNSSDKSITIPKRARLESVIEYQQDGAYLAIPDHSYLASGGWLSTNTRSWKRKLARGIVGLAAAYSVLTSSTAPADSTGRTATELQIDPKQEHVLANGVTVYGPPSQTLQLASIVNSFPEIWQDQGQTVDIDKLEWMPINLKPGAVPKPARPYPVSQKDKEVIDETFDKLHAQGKITWSNQPTPFSYPVFIVWRDTPTGRKGRAVIDIRALNKITESDTYPIPLQSDITSLVAGFPFITAIDATG